ncbi:OmpA family protein [bacterium]|nr:OmpA family protein [bacterium]
MDESLVLNVGASRGITGGYGSPDFRGFTSISYSFGKHKKKPAAAIKEKVLFPFDRDQYYPEYDTNIDRIANYWKAHKDVYVKLSVAGHTDSKGSNAYNDNLSIRRAKAVAKALVAKGVPSDKIIVSTFGENEPVAPNETTDGKDNPDGRQQNRRVEITLLKKE